MPLKKRLVDGHVLEAHDLLLVVALDNAIHEQHREPMRQRLEDRLGIQD